MVTLQIYQLNWVLKELEIDKKYEIFMQEKPISTDVIIKDNKIFLPYLVDFAKFIGKPHGTIEPISKESLRYTQISKTNETEGIIDEKSGFWIFKKDSRDYIPLKKGEYFDLIKTKNLVKAVKITYFSFFIK